MLANAGRAALKNSILFGAPDPAVQGLNILAGVQDQYSPLRTLTAAGLAAAFGGGAHLGTEVLGKLAARWRPGFGDAARGGSVEVRVFRVEGEPNLRIDVFETGDVIVRDNAHVLFLNFGSRPRAEEFLARRIAQGMKDPVIKSFNVPRGFLEDVRAAAVRERKSSEYPGRPLVVDETRVPDQFGLRGQWIDQLRDAIVQGSGRIER